MYVYTYIYVNINISMSTVWKNMYRFSNGHKNCVDIDIYIYISKIFKNIFEWAYTYMFAVQGAVKFRANVRRTNPSKIRKIVVCL